ncbi:MULTISPECIES: hypothetical protein [Facklamia]|uniref:FMN-binding domain-containing protein n=1 Tax=Facklamia hominis TaxID=178214 RepID=A0AAJ1Q768_9LACT|nr:MULTISPECIES: hypothetical protein [Facklamia]MDK7187918.1 hypothetical protein [Facklamia hominis]OFL66160.1 hypothetical protein HMPREF2758_07555 [Facklamia sp. HMSC062C11]
MQSKHHWLKHTLLFTSMWVLAACSQEAKSDQSSKSPKDSTELTSSIETSKDTQAQSLETTTTSQSDFPRIEEAVETTQSPIKPLDKDTPLKDGRYQALSPENEQGNQLYHVIVVKDGKVQSSDFDYFNQKHNKISKSEEYNLQMKQATGVDLEEVIEALDSDFLANPYQEVDAIAGASQTVMDYKGSAQVLMAAASRGDQSVQKVSISSQK